MYENMLGFQTLDEYLPVSGSTRKPIARPSQITPKRCCFSLLFGTEGNSKWVPSMIPPDHESRDQSKAAALEICTQNVMQL